MVDVKTVRYAYPQRVLKPVFIYPPLLYSSMWGVNVVRTTAGNFFLDVCWYYGNPGQNLGVIPPWLFKG